MAIECACGWVKGQPNDPETDAAHMTHLLTEQAGLVAAEARARGHEPTPWRILDPSPGPHPASPAAYVGHVHLYLARDPDDGRVFAQAHEWDEGSFPKRHFQAAQPARTWERRQVDVEADIWARLLRGEIPPIEQDELHATWWEAAT